MKKIATCEKESADIVMQIVKLAEELFDYERPVVALGIMLDVSNFLSNLYHGYWQEDYQKFRISLSKDIFEMYAKRATKADIKFDDLNIHNMISMKGQKSLFNPEDDE